jgi:3-methyl-2-oxobutanoate hydroxymethyltransferase
MPEKVSVPRIRAMRERGERIVVVTAYDAVLGELADTAGVDIILVGDSVGNVLLGYENTLSVTLEQMVHHTRATRAGVQRALLVADLPFGSYNSSVAQAVDSSVALMRAGAQAVKLEGDYPEAVAAIVRAGIPVMGHLGMTPQSVNVFGGHRVQGKGDAGDRVIEEAKRLEESGAFGVVLELVPAALAQRVTQAVNIATIGIGGGIECSGQVQVMHDVLGLSQYRFKHARPFVEGRDLLLKGLQSYTEEVRAGTFPGPENSF